MNRHSFLQNLRTNHTNITRIFRSTRREPTHQEVAMMKLLARVFRLDERNAQDEAALKLTCSSEAAEPALQQQHQYTSTKTEPDTYS